MMTVKRTPEGELSSQTHTHANVELKSVRSKAELDNGEHVTTVCLAVVVHKIVVGSIAMLSSKSLWTALMTLK